MSNINDGGSAFPCPSIRWTNKDGSESVAIGSNGMTLRDWFAGQALASGWVGDYSPMKAAEHAYKYADGMLAQRAKGGAK